MIVLGVWIKFFLSWKRELDNPDYDIDLLAMNNVHPDDMNVDKEEPCMGNNGGYRKVNTIENDINDENKSGKL